jgi:glycosyltransferase involved in cell wall biosynthesis
MNILFSSWYAGLGGGETDLLTLAAALPPRIKPHLMVPREGPLAARWRALGGLVHIVPFRGATTLFVPGLWARFPVVARVEQVLHRAGIGLVHADYHSLPIVEPAARRARVPLMWTVHGWWFRPKPWQRAFFRHIPAVARSHSVRAGFLGKPPFMPVERLPVIYSGVDTARFSPAEAAPAPLLPAQGAGRVVAMVARFQSVKGHEVFQQMAQQVALQLPFVRFIVAGENAFGVSGDQRYRDRILRQAQEDPLLRDRIHYLGFRDDVERIYQSADVVVCASDFESYGKANLEAMACGVPVVSTNAGGPSETVIDGYTGYLVAPRDVRLMSLRVLELLRDEALRRRLGQQARQHVLENFSVDTMLAAYLREFSALAPGITSVDRHSQDR